MIRKKYTLSLLTMIVAFVVSNAAFSQEMGGSFSLKAVLNAGSVSLSWEQPENFAVSYYLVYRTEFNPIAMTDMPVKLGGTVIDSTSSTMYVDTTTPPPYMAYLYLVRAFDASGDSLSSNVALVYANSFMYHRDQVTITSTPPLYATVDSLYTYQVTATSDSPSAVLHYRLGEHPELMVIDSTTGLITWIPQARGWYEVEVIVTSSLGGIARQEFTVRVANINATVAGTVTDTTGKPLPHVMIHLYRTWIPSVMGLETELPGFFDYKAETDSSGHYAIGHVDRGSYFVRAIPLNQNYLPAWYNNVQNLKNATPIAVTVESTYTANFELRNRFYTLPKFTVSGTVTDTLNNPITSAVVVFARAGFVFNEAKEDQQEWSSGENFRDFFSDAIRNRDVDHHFDLDDIHSPYVFRTHVDSNGSYTDTLPQGNYIAFAVAKGYFKTFYKDTTNPLSATILALTSDTTNINFEMVPIPPVVFGQISGSVIDSTTKNGVPARLIAFRDVWNYKDTLRMHVAGAYFTDADSTGAYEFDSLAPGYYKILAIPLGNYAPSFYSLTGPTVRWKEATAIPINGNSVSGINISVVPLPDSASGYASINGRVTSSVTNTGVNGAIVYSTDLNGNIMGYGVTDVNGNYTIAGIAPGTFNVFTDVVGYSSTQTKTASPSYSTTDGSVQPSTANFTVTPESPTAVKAPPVQPTTYSLEQNYPNPFNPTTQIAFNIEQSEHVTIDIFNILGQRVATLVNSNLGAGVHVVTWDGRNQHGELMPSGVYFYRLSTPNFTAVKKMVLLK
jgi:hypothetical protein